MSKNPHEVGEEFRENPIVVVLVPKEEEEENNGVRLVYSPTLAKEIVDRMNEKQPVLEEMYRKYADMIESECHEKKLVFTDLGIVLMLIFSDMMVSLYRSCRKRGIDGESCVKTVEGIMDTFLYLIKTGTINFIKNELGKEGQ